MEVRLGKMVDTWLLCPLNGIRIERGLLLTLGRGDIEPSKRKKGQGRGVTKLQSNRHCGRRGVKRRGALGEGIHARGELLGRAKKKKKRKLILKEER